MLAQTPKWLTNLISVLFPPHVSITSVTKVCIGSVLWQVVANTSKHTQKKCLVLQTWDVVLIAFADSGCVSRHMACHMSSSRLLWIYSYLYPQYSLAPLSTSSFCILSIQTWSLELRARHTSPNFCWKLQSLFFPPQDHCMPSLLWSDWWFWCLNWPRVTLRACRRSPPWWYKTVLCFHTLHWKYGR